MKAINFKLATFTFAAMLLASCSDSNSDGGTDIGKSTTVVGSAVEAQYANDLAGRVTNYKVNNTTASARKLISRAYSGPEVKVPADAKKLSDYIGHEWDFPAGSYVVEEGETVGLDKQFNLSGKNIYVKGTFYYDASYNNDKNSNITILSTGKMIINKNWVNPFEPSNVMNYGEIDFGDAAKVTIQKSFYDNTDLLDLSGKDIELTNNGQLYTNGTLKAKSISLNNGTTLWNGCSIYCDGNLYLTNGSTLHAAYIKTKQLNQDSGSHVYIQDQTMIECSELYNNQNQGTTFIDLADKNGVAVIKAPKITFNAPGPDSDGNILCDLFRTTGSAAAIILDTKSVETGNQHYSTDITSKVTFGDNANVYLSSNEESKKFYIKATVCNPEGFNDPEKNPTKPTEPEEPTNPDAPDTNNKPSLDLITSIDYDNHEHEISATGIMAHNGRMYMSYHTRDAKHGGCVEVFTPVTNNKVTLEQYLYDAAEDLDFNHLLAVKKKDSNERMVYLPGSSNKKGAMLAYIPILDNHLLATESKEITTVDENGEKKVIYQQPLNFVQMNPATEQYHKAGYDENCVVYNDKTNHLIVMTTKGYLVYDADTYNELEKIEKPGKAKHVAIGNGKIVTLYLDREAASEEEAIPATVEVFDQKDEDLTNPLHSFTVNTIEPNNGKNVVAVKDNQIYVCRGAAGLYVYDMEGNEQWHYQMPNPINKEGNYKALANGCYVGDKYVYIAYGSYGLVVLDKTTHKVVARRAVVKSANYVVEHKGYIYVAYGKNRLQVFQLKNADPETSYEK